MRRLKAKSKLEKCKYKRCTYKRVYPEDKPKYCEKHAGQAGFFVPIEYRNDVPPGQIFLVNTNNFKMRRTGKLEPVIKPSLLQRIKAFIFQ